MKKIYTLLLSVFVLLSLFSCCFVEPAQAQLIVMQRYDYYMPASPAVQFGHMYRGQTFTASSTYNATIFSFMLSSTTNAAFPFVIYNVGVNGLPSTVIYSTTVDASSLTASAAWFNITVPSGIVFTAGQQYFLGFYSVDNNALSVYGIVAGTYAGGRALAGTSFTNINTALFTATTDFAFQIFGYEPVAHVGDFSYLFIGPVRDADPQGSDRVMLTLTGTDGSSSQVSLASGQQYLFSGKGQLAAASWNFSSALDLTRTIEFLSSDGTAEGQRNFQIFTANSDWVNGVYVFSVVDYTGEAQYLEVRIGNQVVERRNLALSGSADFTLYKGLTYTLNVVGRTGVFSQLFTAGNIYSSNIVLLAGSFGEVTLADGRSEVFSAVWSEGKIRVFFDSPVRLGSFNFTIFKRDGANLFSVYNGSVAAGLLPFTFLWDGAEVGGSYVVEGWQYAGGAVVKSWRVDVASSTSKSNPWAALLAPFATVTKTLPASAVLPEGFDVAQIPVAIVLAFILAIFSWKNHGIGCLLCWVFAVVMVALGWWTVAPWAFGFALFVSVLIVLVEGKQREREL